MEEASVSPTKSRFHIEVPDHCQKRTPHPLDRVHPHHPAHDHSMLRQGGHHGTPVEP